ncbi:hypothetical protein PINS_up001881 [Pythium insidiosum]|nr:hypothetical protein PINS_up001881 [Pythium insidiosum]
MALQRNNFRTGGESPTASLRPERRRLQVGATNLSRVASTAAVAVAATAAAAVPHGPPSGSGASSVPSGPSSVLHGPGDVPRASPSGWPLDDVSSAVRHCSESTLALRLESLPPRSPQRMTSGNAATSSSLPLSARSDARVLPPVSPRPASSHGHESESKSSTLFSPKRSARRADEPSAMELRATRQTLHDAFVSRYGSVRAVFKAFDGDGNGMISFQRFKDMVEAADVALSDAETRRVFQHVDANGDNTIEFREFTAMFTPAADSGDAATGASSASYWSPPRGDSDGVATDPSNSYALKVRAPLELSPRARERMRELRLRVNGQIAARHGREVSVHGGKTQNLLIYAFKQFDADNDGFLSYDQVKRALGREYLQLDMAASDLDEMVRLIDRNADEKISMKEFVQYFGAGERELPTDLLDNARKKELAALHRKATAPLTPRDNVDPELAERRRQFQLLELQRADDEHDSANEDGNAVGCMQETLAARTFAESRRALRESLSTPALGGRRPHTTMTAAPTLSPLLSSAPASVVPDRLAYWRSQRTDWGRVGCGGDGVAVASALYLPPSERFKTTTHEAFSPLLRGANSGDVFRNQRPTTTLEADARDARRRARHAHTTALLDEMARRREYEARVQDWESRAKVRLGAERRFVYLDRIHDQEQRVALKEAQMAKRHGGVRFHRMWAGSPDSQFNRPTE